MRKTIINDKGQWLNWDAASSYQRALAAGCPTGGISAMGAGRTRADQEVLYKAYKAGTGNLAAKPGTSLHEQGNALDMERGTAAQLWMVTGGDPYKVKAGEKLRAHDYGWHRTVPSEAWHFSYDRQRDKVLWRLVQTAVGGLVVDGIPGPKTLAALKAWQKAHGLAADEIPGPATLAKLTKPAPAPAPAPAPTPSGVDFRAASYNAQLQRFGGGPYSADAAFVTDVLRPSILMAQEVDETARTAILSKGVLTKTYPLGTTALLWDGRKYRNGARIEVRLGTAYHGMIGTELVSVTNGGKIVAASVHIRPNDAIKGTDAQKLAGKLSDVRKILAALAKYPNVMVGGDWSTGEHRALLEKAGYRLVTPWTDTYDKAGTQRLDAIYIRGPLLTARTGGSVYPTAASDHHGLVANLTLAASAAATN